MRTQAHIPPVGPHYAASLSVPARCRRSAPGQGAEVVRAPWGAQSGLPWRHWSAEGHRHPGAWGDSGFRWEVGQSSHVL